MLLYVYSTSHQHCTSRYYLLIIVEPFSHTNKLPIISLSNSNKSWFSMKIFCTTNAVLILNIGPVVWYCRLKIIGNLTRIIASIANIKQISDWYSHMFFEKIDVNISLVKQRNTEVQRLLRVIALSNQPWVPSHFRLSLERLYCLGRD